MENMALHMLLFGFMLIVAEDEGDLHVFFMSENPGKKDYQSSLEDKNILPLK